MFSAVTQWVNPRRSSTGEMLDSGKSITITCTPGRSGTGFLQHVFSLFPDFHSEHESDVREFKGRHRRVAQDEEFGRKIWRQKFALINSLAENRYFEASHLLNKGYIEPLLAFGVVPNMVVLRRNFREVATSLLRLNTVPARTIKGQKFLLRPDDAGVWHIPEWRKLTDYQLCYWYVLETEKRSQRYARLIAERGGRVFETSVDALVNSDNAFAGLCRFSDVNIGEVREKFDAIKNCRVNEKACDKGEIRLEQRELDEQERLLLDLIAKARISIPPAFLTA